MNLSYKLFRIAFAGFFSIFLSGSLLYGQNVNQTDALKQVLFRELSKSLASRNLPSEKSVHMQLFSSKEKSEHRLDNQPADAFYIKATTDHLQIGSATVEGLQNGVYWYLAYLGFRYYFPNDAWYFVPELTSAFKAVEKTVIPSYTHRRIWYGFGTGSKKADQDYQNWVRGNLLGGDDVRAGHAYDAIVARNKEVFQQHPEYFAQKVSRGSIPKNPKFNVNNEALVQLCIQDAFAQIEAEKEKSGKYPDMISMDPSDGGGFAMDTGSEINTPGKQTFYLANRVAGAVRKKYPSVKVGMYAYYQHAAPPSFDLEPNLVVLIATAMNQSAYRTDELITAWKKKGVTIGIRDYYGVLAWDWDMPGQPNGSRIAYVNQLKTYHASGIRLFSAETNVGWISRGLGHYIAAQLLWDVAGNVSAMKSAFFKNMFGRAAPEMEQLFDAWQAYRQPVPLEGDLYQWSRLVERAAKAEQNNDVQRRINQVKQYLHFVHLFMQWRTNNTDENLIGLLNYAYRVQDNGIVASYPLFRRLANTAVKDKANMRFNDKNALWKRNDQPVSEAEVERHFNEDMRSLNQDKKTVLAALPDKFSSVAAIKPGSNITSLPVRLRGGHKIVFQLSGNDAAINLSAGLIKAKEFKTLRLKIYPYNGSLQTENREPVLQESIMPKQPVRSVSLQSLKEGAYIAVIDDARNGFIVSFTGAVAYGVVADGQNRIWTTGRNNLVFAVDGIKEFSINNEGAVTLRSPTGRTIDLQKKKGALTIKVERGEEGVWALQKQSGILSLQGVVPLVSSEEKFLLQHKQ